MLSNELLYSGIVALLPRAAVAAWISIVLLRLADRRASAFPALILLAVISLVLQQLSAWQIGNGNIFWSERFICWQAFSLLTLCYTGFIIRSWSTFRPRQIHEEQSNASDKAATKIRKQQFRAEARGRKQTSTAAALGHRELLLLVFGLAISIYSTLVAWWNSSLVGTPANYAIIAGLVNAFLWAVAILVSIELTFLSSPDTLNPKNGPRVEWGLVAYPTLAAFIISLLVSCSILFPRKLLGQTEDLANQVMPGLFALSWMVLACITWMAPHRIHHFQQKGEAKEWASLAIAAWIANVCFLVVAILPSNWPWKFL